MRGRLTIFAFCGAASGTSITSMLKSAVFGSSFGSGRAAGQLVTGTHLAGARAVDVEVLLVRRRVDQRVRVRAAAGLHRRHLLRLLEVGDVEDADAAEPLRARRARHAPRAAVEAAARLLDRHEEQVAVDRDVALAAGADDRRDQLRLVASARCRRRLKPLKLPRNMWVPLKARSELAKSNPPGRCGGRGAFGSGGGGGWRAAARSDRARAASGHPPASPDRRSPRA